MKNLLIIFAFLAVSCGGRDEQITPTSDGYTVMPGFGTLSGMRYATYNGEAKETKISFSPMGSGVTLTLVGVDYSQPQTYTTANGGYYLKINGTYAQIKISQSVTYPSSTVRKKITFTGFPTGSGSYEMQETP